MLTIVPTNTFYVRFYDYLHGKVWDNTNEVMTAIASVAVADCSVAQTFNTTHQLGTITVPTELPKDRAYVVHIYDKTGAAAASDTPDGVLLLINKTTGPEFVSSMQFPINTNR